MYLFMQKRLNGMPENVASRRIYPKWQPKHFIVYKTISKYFAGINHQSMDTYHTKKQTENIPRSCSYLFLKTLFYCKLHCTSVPYLESSLCKLDKKLDNYNFLHLFSQETDLLRKVIMKCANIKLWDILGCFHYILNTPRRHPSMGSI